MRKALGAVSATSAVLLVFACSSSSAPHPPVEGCQGSSCVGGGAGGGGSGASGSSGGGGTDSGTGDDATTGNCGVASNASQCTSCLGQQCCTQLTGCTSDTNCNYLHGCVIQCGGGSTCINTCENDYPAGASLYEALLSCSQKCATCTESGAGDPCGGLSSYPCASNLSCNGQWCTRICTQDSDCTGLGLSNGNYLGNANACVQSTSGGRTCAPGCNGPKDCAAYPGTICRSSSDAGGFTVFVCGAGTASDAATE